MLLLLLRCVVCTSEELLELNEVVVQERMDRRGRQEEDADVNQPRQRHYRSDVSGVGCVMRAVLVGM